MALTDRRRSRRRALAVDEPSSLVRLRAGRELLVLDVSPGGVLVEGDVRLLPGTHVDVHPLTPEWRLLARSRVAPPSSDFGVLKLRVRERGGSVRRESRPRDRAESRT